MKKGFALLLILTVMIAGFGCRAEAKCEGKIVILATGGTIAGTGEQGKSEGYKPGALTAEQLVDAIPEIGEAADVDVIQICNVNSDDITDEIWLELAETINTMAEDPDVRGFVVTHGTDTMEETAYFLDLTVKTDKPVVITGSMRPSTSLSPDGPMNLYEAVCLAASDKAIGKGVLVVFSDRIYSGRSVEKRNTYHVTAIATGEMGAIGVIRDGNVHLYEAAGKAHTTSTEFDVLGLSSLPRVPIIYFAIDADPEILRFAAEGADGIVIAGAGAGSYSEEYIEVIKTLSIPVVVSSRTGDGIVLSADLLNAEAIPADNLPPQKAAVLLRLALTETTDTDQICEMFEKY